MAALTTEATNRFGAQYLINLTNPFNTSETTVDATRLANAAADAQGRFEVVVGVAYDEDNARHTQAGVTGVHCFLLKRSGKTGAAVEQVCGEFEQNLNDLALSEGAFARIVPDSSSDLTPSVEVQDGETVRPDFDGNEFDDTIPNPTAD